MSKADPWILNFLMRRGRRHLEAAAGRPHDAAHRRHDHRVLTWTTYLLARTPTSSAAEEVDEVCGDRKPTIEDMMNLKFTTRVINESMRLYPQPPVLIRRRWRR